MRTFSLGPPTDRKVVTIEQQGSQLHVTQIKPDGTTKRAKKELASEAEARSESDRMARDLISGGYAERPASGTRKVRAAGSAPAKTAAPRGTGGEPDGIDLNSLYDDIEGPAAAPVLSRLAPAPAAEGAPRKAKAKKDGAKKKKKKKGEKNPDALDKRVLAAVGAFALACLCGVGYVVYDAVLKPPTIVGTWAGSMIDFEIGKPMIHTQYRLVLDERQRASLTLQEKFTSVGTYAVKGNRLILTLKDQGGDDGAGDGAEAGEDRLPPQASERQYKIALRRATLDLFDPESGKKLVQLIRFFEKPVVGGAPAPAAPPVGDAVAAGAVDKDADARLASVEFAPKDGAFRLRHPQGWATDTGSRPDNTYSWATFTQGSAKVAVYADIGGSLMSGSDSAGQYEEGSELAPVHRAHEMYQKTASEEFSKYNEGKPTLFKGAMLGEGRIAAFTASGGLFGSKLRGYRVTLLSRDRRVSILCSCPAEDFKKMEPTFLAVCRSFSH